MKQLVIRLPDELHATLTALAKQERRSLNSEMVIRLERSVTGNARASGKRTSRPQSSR